MGGRRNRLQGLVLSTSDSRVVPLIFAAVALLAVGMIIEDLSKNALAERNPSAFVLQFRWLMPSERFDRSQALTESPEELPRDEQVSRCRHPLSKEIDDRTVVQFNYSGLGEELRTLLSRIKKPNVDEHRAFERWARAETVWRARAASLGTKRKATFAAQCKDYTETLSPLYYVAKNHVYTEDNFFKELQSLRVKYDFARSICYVLLVGAYLVVLLFLAQNTVTMWRDISGGKTVMSFVLGVVLVFAAADAIAFPSSEGLCGLPSQASARCEASLNAARLSFLPATFFFVCMYRARRIWPRLMRTVKLSIDSVIPNPLVFTHARERDARNAVMAVGILLLLSIPIQLTYSSVHSNFLKRVYAYYVVVRGTPLEPAATPAVTGSPSTSVSP